MRNKLAAWTWIALLMGAAQPGVVAQSGGAASVEIVTSEPMEVYVNGRPVAMHSGEFGFAETVPGSNRLTLVHARRGVRVPPLDRSGLARNAVQTARTGWSSIFRPPRAAPSTSKWKGRRRWRRVRRRSGSTTSPGIRSTRFRSRATWWSSWESVAGK